jgi:solute carrier family 25 carnitine/acylcarnitine transporter 20/29
VNTIWTMRLLEEVLASAAAGCASTALGHPLDCVKVQLQTGKPGMSTWKCASNMLLKDGLSAFTRGIGAPLANAILMNSVMFVAFAEARKRLPDDAAGSLLAGALSGVVQATLSTPVDWAKIQAQVHGGKSSELIVRAAQRFPGVLYTGHVMNLCREGIFTAIYLGLYSHIRRTVEAASGPQGGSDLALVALTSATTGAIAWVSCFPFDTVKSKQQSLPPTAPPAKRSIRACASALISEGGVAALYRGVGTSTFRAILVTCSRLVAYEGVARLLGARVAV